MKLRCEKAYKSLFENKYNKKCEVCQKNEKKSIAGYELLMLFFGMVFIVLAIVLCISGNFIAGMLAILITFYATNLMEKDIKERIRRLE